MLLATKNDVMQKAAEQEVNFIRLEFTDIFGILKNVTITVNELEKALDGELMFDGSSIDGFVRIDTVNSYKHLVPGYEAPVYLAWSGRNRSPLIRIPAKRGLNTRLEVRNPDPACNPYLALSVMIKAGLDGIQNKILPPPPQDTNIYRLSENERRELGIGNLPANLTEALEELSRDEVIKSALGKHNYDRFIEAKNIEWAVIVCRFTSGSLMST